MIVAAIDTGGTKIAGAAITAQGEILDRIRIPNTGRSGPFIMDSYFKIIDTLREKYEISAIGIGAGGRINPETGKVLYAVGIYKDYIGLEIKDILQKRYKLPVAVDNDCRVALYGEKWLGAIKDYNKVFGLILGTGVGGGLLIDGTGVYGQNGGFGEIGHAILHAGGRQCTCGQSGCVEQYLSGTALYKIYNDRGVCPKISSGYEFFRLLEENDSCAKSVIKDFVDDLAICAVTCANIFDPQVLLFGGGIVDTHRHWWSEFSEKYYAYGNIHTRKVPLIRASKGNDAAILGAAFIALNQLKN